MADRIYDPDTLTPTAQDFDGSWHTFGSHAVLDEDGNLTGGGAWFPNPKPDPFRWVVFKFSDQSIIAEVDLTALPSPTLGDWNDFTSASFVTPGNVTLDPDEEYIVAVASPDDFVYRDSGVAFPYGAGIIRATEAAFFNGGSGPTFPDSFSTSFVFFADMIVEPAGGAPVAVTGQSSAAASSASTALKIVIAVGRAVAAASSTSIAAKVAKANGTTAAAASSTAGAHKTAVASGASIGAAAATAAAVKVVHCTAVCSAAAASSSAVATKRPAVATTTTAPTSTATATKRATAGGSAYAIAISQKAGQDIRSVSATCYAVAVSTARYRRVVRRPNTGVITRPFTGIITRP